MVPSHIHPQKEKRKSSKRKEKKRKEKKRKKEIEGQVSLNVMKPSSSFTEFGVS